MYPKVNGVRGIAATLLKLMVEQDEIDVTWMRMPPLGDGDVDAPIERRHAEQGA